MKKQLGPDAGQFEQRSHGILLHVDRGGSVNSRFVSVRGTSLGVNRDDFGVGNRRYLGDQVEELGFPDQTLDVVLGRLLEQPEENFPSTSKSR